MTEREQFEKWYTKKYISTEALEWDDDGYIDFDHNRAFEAFKGGLALSGVPVAWAYELAHGMDNGVYVDWYPRLSEDRPNVPQGSIRNLRALVDAVSAAPVAWTVEQHGERMFEWGSEEPEDPAYKWQALGLIGAPADEPKLDKRAQVGHTRFGVGVKWSTVVAAAQRHHDYMNTPEKESKRIEKAKAIIDEITGVAPAELPTAAQIYEAIEGVAATRTSPESVCDVLAIINRLRKAKS